MEIDFASLAARIAADVPGLRGCVIVSRDGLVLGAFPQDGESILRPAWLRFGTLGDVEKGFVQFPGELWVFVRRGPYASFATSNETARPGLLLDQMEQVLANAEEIRAAQAAQSGVTLPESPEIPRAQPQAPPVAAPPVQAQPAPTQPQAPPPQPVAPAQPVAPPPQAVPPQAPPPPAAPAQPEPAQAGPSPVPVAPGPQVGYHADYGAEGPPAGAAQPDPTSTPAAPAADDIQIDRVALAQEFASLLAETGYDDEDDSA